MTGDLHANNLRDTRTAHIANRGPAKIVKFQIRYASIFAGLRPRAPKGLDRLTVAMENSRPTIRFLQRPFEPGPHISI